MRTRGPCCLLSFAPPTSPSCHSPSPAPLLLLHNLPTKGPPFTLKATQTFLATSFSMAVSMTGYRISFPSLSRSTFPSKAGDFLASAWPCVHPTVLSGHRYCRHNRLDLDQSGLWRVIISSLGLGQERLKRCVVPCNVMPGAVGCPWADEGGPGSSTAYTEAPMSERACGHQNRVCAQCGGSRGEGGGD